MPGALRAVRLGEKQELFAHLLPSLIRKAEQLGFKVRVGEVLRFEHQARWNAEHCRKCKRHKAQSHSGHKFKAIGIVNSLHRQKLAVDLIFFDGGKPCWDTSSYTELGEWWEQKHALCRWGGGWGDGGHFSLTHGGRK